jgi:hypothetical protein
LIDELAFDFPHVVFIVSTGNQSPLTDYESISKIIENYPRDLIKNDDFRIINPATSVLALTIGSIAGEERIEQERYGAEKIRKKLSNVIYLFVVMV